MGGKIAVVTSGKGGVGKTTTTAHLGAGIARRGHTVALIDADIGLRNLDAAMGLEGRIVYDLVDVIEGLCEAGQALIPSDGVPGLWLMPASQSRRQDSIGAGEMRGVAEALSEKFDWVLVDCPAGVEHGFLNAVSCAGTAVVVTTPDVAAVRDARKVAGLLEESRMGDIRLVVNRYRPAMARKGASMTAEEVGELLPVRLLGVIPEDPGALAAANRGRLLERGDGPAGAAYDDAARRMLGEEPDTPMIRPGRLAWLRALWGAPP